MKLKRLEKIAGVNLLIGMAAAETTTYTLGDALNSIFNYFGFQILDLTNAIYTLFYVIIIVGVLYIFLKWTKR
jgi:hypothetical protein